MRFKKLDADIRINRWGIKSLLEVENAYEPLTVFEMFYRLDGRFPLTNGLLFLMVKCLKVTIKEF